MENKEETLNLEQGFNIILHAGNAKNLALEAITLAEESQINASKIKLEEANREVNEAHKEHKDLLDQLANGKIVQMDLILTHALDHLTSAEVICLVAQKFINLYEKR